MNDELRAKAIKLLEDNFKCKPSEDMRRRAEQTSFAGEFGALALDNVFANLWCRPGLDLRSRSLLTLGILIALGANDELGIHGIVALNNGLSLDELEEVLYHATGYAGFARASAARQIIADALVLDGRIEKKD